MNAHDKLSAILGTNPDELDAASAIKRMADNTEDLKLLDKDLYEMVNKCIQESVPTDIVDCDETQLYKFARYWKDLGVASDVASKHLIPVDIVIDGTIPIMDLIIRNKHCSSPKKPFDIRIVVFQQSLENCKKAIDHSMTILFGAVVMPDGMIIPLTIDTGEIALSISLAIAFPIPYHKAKQFVHNTAMIRYKKELIITLLSTVLPAWYGIELALLHPVTKQVFANPIKEKRDRKEQLKTTIINGVPKRVKYIKRHVITSENNIDTALDSAMETVCHNLGTEKRKYERHSYLWRVIGHKRTLANGRVVWVKPFWKGPLKDFPNDGIVTKNMRDVDIGGN